MAWKENLRPASFKGVPFKVEDHEAEYGRRLVVNEYPYRDEPYTEDLGASARRYNVTAYIIGDDYMSVRDALLDAIEAGGAGVLIHPYLGTKDVICETARLRESRAEGRIAVISMSFVQAGQKLFPVAAPIAKDLVSMKADELISVARTNFIEEMVVSGVPEWVRDAYAGTLQDVAAIFTVIRSNGGINNQTTTALINKAAEWVADVSDLAAPSLTLIQDLAGAADRIINTFAGVFDLSTLPAQATKNLRRFSDFTAAINGANTANAIVADNNAAVSEGFIKTIAVATETKAIVSETFPSYEDAILSRGDLLDRIEALAGETLSDTLYDAFRSLRTEVANAIPGEENSLPRISSLNLKQSMPSLVVAYDLYEDVEKEQEIVDRNKIRHPGYLPGGANLNVLQYDENTA